MVRVLLAVPQKGDCINELSRVLTSEEADIYIFPEGFLNSDTIKNALSIIRNHNKFVITGFKEFQEHAIFEKALVIDSGDIIDEYTKCILTKTEKEKGKVSGDNIHCVETKYGKIGIPICYEIHFPEVARILSIHNPVLLINLIGTGMYHELQYEQWTSLAKARAIENEIYMLGCSHYAGEIPLAYAYAPNGKCLLEKKNEYGAFSVEIDLEESNKKVIGYFEDRIPKYFKELGE